MSKKFWYLTRVSLKKKIGSKWFLITNIILALAVIGIININSIIKFFGGDFSDNLTVYVIDNSNTFNYFETTLDALDEDNLIKIEQTSKTKDELTKDLENSEIIVILNENDREFLTSEIISNETIDNGIYQEITSAINASKSTLGMIKSNVNP